jgi:hypothetical protein
MVMRALEDLTEEELLVLYQELEFVEGEVRKNAITFYQPNLKGQTPFHTSDRRIRILLGGNRSGKTTAGSVEAIAHAIGYRPWVPESDPNYRVRLAGGKPIPTPNVGTILGESYKISVDRVLYPTIQEWLPPELIQQTIRNQQSVVDTLVFKNGSKMRFMTYNQDPKEFEGFKAHWTWYDEPPKHSIFTANERSLIDYGGRSWMTMTPIRQPWIWDRLVSKEGIDKRVEVFRMSIWDNAKSHGGHLENEFIQQFLDSLPKEEREAREKGDFLHLQGRVFSNWQPSPPYWIPYFPPKRDWVRVMGVDPHPRKPIACVWYAISPDTDIWYAYRELYDERLRTVKDVAQRIYELERGETVAFRIMDPSGQENERTSGSSVYEQFADEGLYCELAQKSDKDGRRRILRELLELDSVFNTPGLVVMETCPRLRHEFMNHIWDEWSPSVRDSHDQKQDPVKKDDDILDATMYLLQYGVRARDFNYQLMEGDQDKVWVPEPVGSRTGY